MSAQQPSSSPTRGVDDDGTDLGLAMGFATEHFANTCETVEASGQGYITATEGNQGRRSSTEETQQDDESSHSTTQRQASKDILRLLGVFEPQFIITMLHIRKNRRYRLKVIASTTVMDLATCAAANERVPVAKINLLQDNVVNVFCGGSFMVDGKGAITLSELRLKDEDRINVAVGAQVVVFPRSEWCEDAAGNLKLKGTPWQRFQELRRQRAEAKRRDSANP